jgi:tetratricopeptide (TPR) repeat protein
MFENIFPNTNHSHLADAYLNVGKIYGDIGDYKNALNYLLKGHIMNLKLE